MPDKSTVPFLVAPDYLPDHFSHWYLLSSHLQRESGCTIPLELPASHSEMNALLAEGNIGLLYADAFLAAGLIREQAWLPLVRPVNRYDEVLVAVAADSPYQSLCELPADAMIQSRPNQDICRIGLRLLRESCLNTENIRLAEADSLSLVASALLKGEAQAGFFTAGIYHHLSKHTRDSLRVLQESQLGNVSHLIVLHPKHAALQETLRQAFCGMTGKPAAALILESLDMPEGFAGFTAEEAEIMTAWMLETAPADGGQADEAGEAGTQAEAGAETENAPAADAVETPVHPD
ncbi:MAG: PhnD/SsuA/transferrin family substrate-binding protein [Eikenella sp.]|nr:PhnD/SsuA/transferrin family substrate-binding protein [Eikenella sp.]